MWLFLLESLLPANPGGEWSPVAPTNGTLLNEAFKKLEEKAHQLEEGHEISDDELQSVADHCKWTVQDWVLLLMLFHC